LLTLLDTMNNCLATAEADYSNGEFRAGVSLDTAGRSVPQLRHEPMTYSIFLPQFRQFSTFESVAIMVSYCCYCYGIKHSAWLDQERVSHFHIEEFSISMRQ